MGSKLSVNSHRADIIGLTYIYPVLSRRAGGLSIGINFNTNNTCNWRCVYCQVPNLTLGAAPAIDFALLAAELRQFLADVLHGDFYDRFEVDADKRVIKDIAIAGNGEPTTLKAFARAVGLIGQIATEAGVFPASDYVLITNGSLLHQPRVQEGLRVLNAYHGQVWFKFDSATEAGRLLVNNSGQSCQAAVQNVLTASQLCKTKLQTCLFDFAGRGLPESEKQAYLAMLRQLKDHCNVRQIMLYTIARPSAQPEAAQLAKLPVEELAAFAEEIRQLGFTVSVSG
ncbi:radical SAM protein [Methylovulum psychrotolerans]|jgi:wyosine [tRNA(Phe)-imidazoG37] synthetase (radical SAM superfamily)|uniref:Radical SAM protein n=1 Tax=Methylovulum psychrotolerans TaxID=1704499 RepID=A0A1Z4C340_9GAMM|nr:radical SAM protein [Methylovulum psychrotolerans]ASF47931.1 radical SAM protein [Methylovulum psychrotolerans]